ncbi:hypothetical protein LXD69_03115 [Flavobacterium sediminilitoris]|uniref:Bacteriocin-like protein n=1 Tax=Flavobacterium sediminilitoris TaxID=2024526 RepID=A0ABY4HSJ7_9FLAO|nr:MULTISPECIES: hypothetical protein [Flavobacterium]UOX34509.1 hypothetical protein LXD69_03115 [Flavobacterium sediminilitoris]
MKKSILNLRDVQVLSQKEQKTIKGGIHVCAIDGCPPGLFCTKVGCKKDPDWV